MLDIVAVIVSRFALHVVRVVCIYVRVHVCASRVACTCVVCLCQYLACMWVTMFVCMYVRACYVHVSCVGCALRSARSQLTSGMATLKV